jgi:hypothetical protein
VIDFRSWPKKWNDATLRRVVTLPENSPSRPWPMLGMLALGLVVGAALGGYAVSQRSQMKRLATYAQRMRDELTVGRSKPSSRSLSSRPPVQITAAGRH